jgi:Uma2 family endonuclease
MAEEFVRMPDPADGSKEELVRGVIVSTPAAVFRHGECQGTAGALIRQFVKSNRMGRVTVGSGVVTETNPDTVRGPDVSYYSAERLPLDATPVVYANVAPDLCVEVRSPSNTKERMTAKVREYFACGVRTVWVIDPEDRTVTVYRQAGDGRVLWEDAILTGEDVLPGFSCKVAELFE